MVEQEEQELPQQVIDLAEASVPDSVKGIRACKVCGILKTMDQYINDGKADVACDVLLVVIGLALEWMALLSHP